MTITQIFNEVSKREFELFTKYSNLQATAEEIEERNQCVETLQFFNKQYSFTLSDCNEKEEDNNND